MQGFKQEIANRFSIASHTYDNVAHVQRECAERLLSQMLVHWPDFYPQQVLDLGTGTGYMPELLLPKFPHTQFMLNDVSLPMLRRALARLSYPPQVACHHGDFEQATFAFHELIVSNLAFQWALELQSMIEACYQNADRLAFSCLLEGTFAEWGRLFEGLGFESPVRLYASKAEVERTILALRPKAYHFTTETFTLSFPNAKAVMGYLQQLGASLGALRLPLSQVKQVLQTVCQPIDLTYEVGFALVRRK